MSRSGRAERDRRRRAANGSRSRVRVPATPAPSAWRLSRVYPSPTRR